MARTRKPAGLTRRLLIWYAVAVALAVAALGFAASRVLEVQLMTDLTGSLEAQAHLIRLALPEDPARLPARVSEWGRASGIRITIISTDGAVLADSSRDPDGMENHAGRPEVAAALAGAVGSDTRLSASLGAEFRYVAVPPADGRIVRTAEPLSEVGRRLARLRSTIVLGATGAAALGFLAVWWAARRIVRPFRLATEGAAELAEGAPVESIKTGGPLELMRMVETVQAMASELQAKARESERERALRDRLLGSLDEGVLLVEGGDSITYANAWALGALGRRSDLLSLPAPLQQICLDVRRSGAPARAAFDHGVPSRAFVAMATPLDEAGGVVIVLQDVTTARRVESMRRDFVADASHELKTPIAAIQAGAETMVRALDEDPAASRAFAEQIRQNTVRLGRIVSDLLDLSRLETEDAHFEPVALDDLVEAELARLAPPGGRAPVELSSLIAPAPVVGSPGDIRLAVRNLLENAQRYAAGGAVRVEVRCEDGEAIVEVADSGIGIPSRDIPRVFERFYRVDVARSRHTGGTGLGLAIVKHVMDRHGGRVEVESELGVGSTFRLCFPLAAPD